MEPLELETVLMFPWGIWMLSPHRGSISSRSRKGLVAKHARAQMLAHVPSAGRAPSAATQLATSRRSRRARGLYGRFMPGFIENLRRKAFLRTIILPMGGEMHIDGRGGRGKL
jgi:hypothetical protein